MIFMPSTLITKDNVADCKGWSARPALVLSGSAWPRLGSASHPMALGTPLASRMEG
jgi:hypothetical protein